MSEKTTFILGAGSNKDYGFPLGINLYDDTINEIEKWVNIDEMLNQKPNENEAIIPLFNVLNHFRLFGVNQWDISPAINYFKNQIKNAELKSLDEFVLYFQENKQLKFETLCKYIISYFILLKEYSIDLSDRNNKNHWYLSLWNEIVKPNFKESKKYGFITFNYDRSLEYYLTSVIKTIFYNNSQKSFADVDKIRNEKFPIYHVYGQMGSLTYKNEFYYGYPDSRWPVGLKRERFIKHIQLGANNINLLFQNRANIEPEIHNELGNTDEIIFLGFGFDKDNLQALNIKNHDIPKKGLAMGIKKTKLDELKDTYGILCDPAPINIIQYLEKEGIF